MSFSSSLLPLVVGSLFGLGLAVENPFGEEDPAGEPSLSDDPSSPPENDESQGSPALSSAAQARELSADAMRALHDGDIDQAFSLLSPHWTFAQEELDQLQQEVERTRLVVGDRYGDPLDYRLLRTDSAGDVLVRLVYLERFEHHGLRWRFTFYEGPMGWTLNDVYFDDEIEELLD